MLALLLSFGLFTLFSFLGAAFVESLGPAKNPLRGALMAPGAGAAVLVLPIFVLSRMNLPVGRFAWALTIALCVGAAAILWRHRPRVSIRQLAPFLIILLCAAMITGYPMLLYGFNWISYGNNDMCSFVMMAHRFAAHGYYELPDASAMLSNRDLGASYWFSYGIEGTRCGADLLIAWLISLTKLTGFQVYMPLLIALHLTLIAAAGALVLSDENLRAASIAACAWLAVSPSNTLGTMYQLMPQILGVTLLAISAGVLLQPMRTSARRETIRFCLFAGLLVAALVVVYYEILPFLVVAIAVYHGVQVLRRRESVRSLIAPALGIFAAIAILLRSWLLAIVPFLDRQAGRSFKAANPNSSNFPYYLVPSGLANFWGFVPIGGEPLRESAMNAAIVAGAMLLLIGAAASLRQAWHGRAAAVISVVMLAVGVRLYIGGGDFGLFKLSMYIQPFLLGSLALAAIGNTGRAISPVRQGGAQTRSFLEFWGPQAHGHSMSVARHTLRRDGYGARWPSGIGLLLVAVIAACGLRSQIFYVKRSLGGPGSFTNLPFASSTRLLDQLARLRAEPHRAEIVSDTNNVTLASVEAVYLNPAELEIPAADFFQNPANLDPGSDLFRMGRRLAPKLAASALSLVQQRQKLDGSAMFDLRNGKWDAFFRWRGPASDDYELLASGPEMSPLNHRHAPAAIGFGGPHNHLIAVASELGGSPSLAGRFGPDNGVALYPSESDYFFPSAMTSVGRYLLFQVLRPSPSARLVVEYTATLNSDGENRIPPIAAIGSERMHIAQGARGAGRFFSPVIEPQQIEGDSYLMLDMGKEPFRMPNNRSGLMTFYGREIRLDTRLITGFVRDVSAIADDEYAAMNAPTRVSHFPADLANPNLEFSGVYEDGWASEDATFVLQGSSRARLEGAAPFGPIEITLLVDGRESARQQFNPGDFRMQSAELPAGKHRIEIRASIAGRLRAPDARKASYLLHSIGF